MKYKVGDTVTINKEPRFWSSFGGGKSPCYKEMYPFTGVIEKISADEETMIIDGYGFDVPTLIEDNNIKLLEIKVGEYYHVKMMINEVGSELDTEWLFLCEEVNAKPPSADITHTIHRGKILNKDIKRNNELLCMEADNRVYRLATKEERDKLNEVFGICIDVEIDIPPMSEELRNTKLSKFLSYG